MTYLVKTLGHGKVRHNEKMLLAGLMILGFIVSHRPKETF
jgi:hypothetical protein